MKAIVRLKDFPGHKGIPGHQGGSLPKGAEAAPADKYHVDMPASYQNIDFSNPQVNIVNNGNIDNSTEPPYVIKNGALNRIVRAHGNDLEVMKEIAKNEKEFYDNPNSTGPDNHIEVRLFKSSGWYGIQYTSFDVNSDGSVKYQNSWVDDFSRCPICKYPTTSPDQEQAYHACDTCGIEYVYEGEE
jgi:hypothetical protein